MVKGRSRTWTSKNIQSILKMLHSQFARPVQSIAKHFMRLCVLKGLVCWSPLVWKDMLWKPGMFASAAHFVRLTSPESLNAEIKRTAAYLSWTIRLACIVPCAQGAEIIAHISHIYKSLQKSVVAHQLPQSQMLTASTWLWCLHSYTRSYQTANSGYTWSSSYTTNSRKVLRHFSRSPSKEWYLLSLICRSKPRNQMDQ